MDALTAAPPAAGGAAPPPPAAGGAAPLVVATLTALFHELPPFNPAAGVGSFGAVVASFLAGPGALRELGFLDNCTVNLAATHAGGVACGAPGAHAVVPLAAGACLLHLSRPGDPSFSAGVARAVASVDFLQLRVAAGVAGAALRNPNCGCGRAGPWTDVVSLGLPQPAARLRSHLLVEVRREIPHPTGVDLGTTGLAQGGESIFSGFGAAFLVAALVETSGPLVQAPLCNLPV